MEAVTELNYSCSDISHLPEVAASILKDAGSMKLFLFYGEMGAGKTTLIKELCRQLGVEEVVSSPTFTIVNEYLTNDQSMIYHFDFYRIKSESEAFDLGYEDYFYSGNYCFVEWPEKIESLLPDKAVKVMITSDGEKRILKMLL